MKKTLYILIFTLLPFSNNAQEVDGTWVLAYSKYSNGNLPYSTPTYRQLGHIKGDSIESHIIDFNNPSRIEQFNDKGTFKIRNGQFIIQYKDQLKIDYELITQDSIILQVDDTKHVLIKLNDSLKNPKSAEIKLAGKSFQRELTYNNKFFTDHVTFKNDSIAIFKIQNEISEVKWQRIKFKGYDIILYETGAPQIIQNAINSSVVVWAIYNEPILIEMIEQ